MVCIRPCDSLRTTRYWDLQEDIAWFRNLTLNPPLNHSQVESDFSDEEAENTKRAAKKVPDWAAKENLRGALAKQAEGELDPDKIFFEVRPILPLP